MKCCPNLAQFVRSNPAGDDTIDFSDPAAVLALNQALLNFHYGLSSWQLPPGYLCPPIPGRADYLHHVADLLAGDDASAIPRGPATAVLDIGVGANCIYPLLGASEYGWRFVGTEIDPVALAWARNLVLAHPTVGPLIECRLQPSRTDIFNGVVQPGETFAASICNPPFHASAAEAAAGSARKAKNLHGPTRSQPVLNFGGQNTELWCAGGEVGFVRRMIAQSAEHPKLCRWFTALVSKRDSLPPLYHALKVVRATEVRTINLAHGQKQSRIVAWTFRV